MPSQTAAAACGACLLLLGLSMFQILLAADLLLGRFAWGRQHRIMPRGLRTGSLVAGLANHPCSTFSAPE